MNKNASGMAGFRAAPMQSFALLSFPFEAPEREASFHSMI
jgi:hypothetical protein